MAGQSHKPRLTKVLRRAITDCGQSVRSISRGSGVDHAVLLRFASGERGITLDTADRLAVYFCLSLTSNLRGSRRRHIAKEGMDDGGQ